MQYAWQEKRLRISRIFLHEFSLIYGYLSNITALFSFTIKCYIFPAKKSWFYILSKQKISRWCLMVPNLLGNWAPNSQLFPFQRPFASSFTVRNFLSEPRGIWPARRSRPCARGFLSPVRFKLWTWKELAQFTAKKCQFWTKTGLNPNFSSLDCLTFKTVL